MLLLLRRTKSTNRGLPRSLRQSRPPVTFISARSIEVFARLGFRERHPQQRGGGERRGAKNDKAGEAAELLENETAGAGRSEERRVGKEWRARWRRGP